MFQMHKMFSQNSKYLKQSQSPLSMMHLTSMDNLKGNDYNRKNLNKKRSESNSVEIKTPAWNVYRPSCCVNCVSMASLS